MSRALTDPSRLRPLVIALVTLASLTASAQTTWYVDDNAPGDPGPGDPSSSDPLEDGSAAHPYDAIQEGINVAVSGDTVLVADGTYTGAGNKNLDFAGRLITVRSANGPETCIIDCQGTGRAFWFHTGETAAAVVDGFSIAGGWSVSGGGMAIWSCATVANCIFSGNFALIFGGGACVSTLSGPTTLFTRCTFINNSVSAGGGGLFVESGSVALVNCVFRGNLADRGGGLCLWGTATLSQCEFVQNGASEYGGAICIEQPGRLPSVTNCAFTENVAGLYGGGIAAWDISDGGMVYVWVYNSTFAGNQAVGGRSLAANTAYVDFFTYNDILWEVDAVHCSGWAGFYPSFCDVLGWSGGRGNIDADPLYVCPSVGDYRLRPGSPCIDAANTTYTPADTFDLDGDGDTSERTPFDLGGHPRFVDDPLTADTGVADPPAYPQVVDMGAYEFQALPGDLDGDGDVDWDDFVIFADCLSGPDLTPGAGCAAADLTVDSDVDLADFAEFQRYFGGPLGP